MTLVRNSSFTSLKTNATAKKNTKINTNDENGITSIEIEEIENYLSYIRPSEEIRDQLDIGYRIEKQSVIFLKLDRIGSIQKKTENKVAKVTFVKKNDH
jgi:hypothetical protein